MSEVMPIPKPKFKKQKKAKNNPKPTDQDVCQICSKPYAELHEVYYGRGKRQLSIKYGMQIRLCYEHHRGPNGVHSNRELDRKLKESFQFTFEIEHNKELFIKLFGKNYIDCEVA